MSTTVLVWKKVDDKIWRASALGFSYELRKFDRDNGGSFFSLYQTGVNHQGLNVRYVISAIDEAICKSRAQEHLNQSIGRIAS